MHNYPLPLVGSKIYYTGDMANQPYFAKVVEIREDSWGTKFLLEEVENGEKHWIEAISFSESPGQRFKTMQQYNDEREEQMAEFKRTMERLNSK